MKKDLEKINTEKESELEGLFTSVLETKENSQILVDLAICSFRCSRTLCVEKYCDYCQLNYKANPSVKVSSKPQGEGVKCVKLKALTGKNISIKKGVSVEMLIGRETMLYRTHRDIVGDVAIMEIRYVTEKR